MAGVHFLDSLMALYHIPVPSMAMDLLQLNIYLTGAVMKNWQNLPADMKRMKLIKIYEVSAFVRLAR